MSSFIVSQKCMNRIINGLFWNHAFKDLYGSILTRKGYSKSEDFQRLGNELFKLNARGTGQRYGEKIKPELFKWESIGNISNIQLLKSMQCLKYQCSEGDTDEQELFKLLETLIESLKDHIISSRKDYQEADWG